MNTLVPAHAAPRRYADSRIVAFSTGNVYPSSPSPAEGLAGTDAPGPIGEYAASCLGRERLFEHFPSGTARASPFIVSTTRSTFVTAFSSTSRRK